MCSLLQSSHLLAKFCKGITKAEEGVLFAIAVIKEAKGHREVMMTDFR